MFTIPATALRDLAASVRPVLSKVDDTLPVLRSVQFETLLARGGPDRSTLRITFTDRYVAVVMTVEAQVDQEGTLLMSWDDLDRIARAWKPTRAEIRNNVTVSFYHDDEDGWMAASWLGTWQFEPVDGKFPDVLGLQNVWDNQHSKSEPVIDPARLVQLSKSLDAWLGCHFTITSGERDTSAIRLDAYLDTKPPKRAGTWKAAVMPIRKKD